MQRSHAAGFAAAEFGEDGAYLDIVDEGWIEVGDSGEGGFQDVREEFVVVGVFEAAFLCAGDGGAEGGEDDYVGGVFLEDVFGAFLEEGHLGGGGCCDFTVDEEEVCLFGSLELLSCEDRGWMVGDKYVTCGTQYGVCID